MVEFDSETLSKIVDLLVERNYLDKHSLRNHRIRKRYYELRKNNSCKSAREIVAKEFVLETKTIEAIIYNKKVDYEQDC